MQFSNEELKKLSSFARALSKWQSAVTLPQVLALVVIARQPGLSVNELAEILKLPQQTASRHVATLLGRYQTPETEAAGGAVFVRQEINPADPRRRALFLSDDGIKCLKALIAS